MKSQSQSHSLPSCCRAIRERPSTRFHGLLAKGSSSPGSTELSLGHAPHRAAAHFLCSWLGRRCRRSVSSLPSDQRPSILSRAPCRPPAIVPRHDPLGNRNSISDGGLQCWGGASVPVRQLPYCENVCCDQQHALSAFVHGGAPDRDHLGCFTHPLREVAKGDRFRSFFC